MTPGSLTTHCDERSKIGFKASEAKNRGVGADSPPEAKGRPSQAGFRGSFDVGDGDKTVITILDEDGQTLVIDENAHDQLEMITVLRERCQRCGKPSEVGCHGIRAGAIYSEHWCLDCHAKMKDKQRKSKGKTNDKRNKYRGISRN